MPQASYADWLAPIVAVMGVMVVSDITLTLLGGCTHGEGDGSGGVEERRKADFNESPSSIHHLLAPSPRQTIEDSSSIQNPLDDLGGAPSLNSLYLSNGHKSREALL